MGFLDKFKGKNTSDMVDKAKDAIAEHEDKIDGAIDKAADAADKATGEKYTDQIDNVAEKLKDATGDDTPQA